MRSLGVYHPFAVQPSSQAVLAYTQPLFRPSPVDSLLPAQSAPIPAETNVSLHAAAVASLDSVSINGLTITMAQVARIAPVVTFHPAEKYFPCSVEYLLQGATLKDASGGVIVKNPSPDDLYAHFGSGGRLDLDPARYTGEPLNPKNRVRAPMYVTVRVPKDASYVDVHFNFMFAFNGAQTAYVMGPLYGYDCVLPHFAEHQGDVEGIRVRLTADMKTVQSVRYEAHGKGDLKLCNEVEFEGTHPIVRCALNSHATYSSKGMQHNDKVSDHPVKVLGFGVDFANYISNEGARWQPFDVCADDVSKPNGQLVFVGLDTRDAPINQQKWVRFAGKIGARWKNTFVGAQGFNGKPLPVWERSWTRMLVNAVRAAGLLVRGQPIEKRLQADGTDGFGNRTWIHMAVTEPSAEPL